MDATQSFIKIYRISPEAAGDFAFDYDTQTDDLLTELVPDLDNWGNLGWVELTDFDYDGAQQALEMTLETQWVSPVEWLRNASTGTHYFENKLITMATIQKDKRLVTGVAVMDGEVLQSKRLLELDEEFVGKHYDDTNPNHDISDLDALIWDAITKFVTVCEQFYLEGEEKND